MAKGKDTAAAENPVPSAKYSKEQILASRRYGDQRDLLAALLKDGERYGHEEIAALVDEFMKGKVKT
jgi:hypothetical protein